MSVENAKKFFERADADEKLKKKIGGQFSEILKTAHEQGLDFTPAEMAEHLRQRWAVKPPTGTTTNECCV